MIQLHQVSKTYPVGDGELTVLDSISLTILPGEFVSIMGPSGSGKSTLMHLMGCLDSPTSGTYVFNGKSVESLTPAELARVRNEDIGFVFQNFHLLPRMTALKNVELPMVYAGLKRRERSQRSLALLEKMGLLERMNHFPSALSGGQKQRVAIARALAMRPALVLADEPTGALDTSTGKEVMDVFTTLHKEGVTLVVITHDENVAAYGQRIIRLVDGRIVQDERTREP